MRRGIFIIMSMLLSLAGFSQITTIYTEDFSNDWKKGAITYGGVTPAQPTDGNWSYTNVGSPDNDGGSASSWDDMAFIDGAAVMSTNGATSSTLAFRWNDVNNGSTSNRVDWYSKSISGAYTTITVSLAYAIGNGSGANSVWAYYKIDGGAWTLFGSSVNQSTASGTFTSSTLSCSSSIQIKVEALTRDFNSAYVTIDNVQITACPVVVPSVSIAASSSSICSGTSVTFTATPTNGGAGPSYQWKLNGANVGTNSTTYSNSGLANGDIVSCVMTSNASCASPSTATSNSTTMTVTSNVTPSVSISGTSSICSGTSVTFTAAPSNGGPAPSYQWKKNGANAGTNSSTYTNSTLANGDVVTVVMTANNSCQTASAANGNSITLQVDSPSVGGTVAADQTIYSGQNPSNISASGITGSVTKWQSSLDNLFATPSDIAVASSTLLGAQMGALSQTTYYRAVVKNGTCASANSSYVTITVATPLPIELLYFKGTAFDSENTLYWCTASESNNDYFTIEKSTDGKEWKAIAKMNGSGNSTMLRHYSAIDKDAERTINYYRLRQTDYDGRFKTSEPISIDNTKASSPKKIDRTTNALGQEINLERYRGLIIIYYEDGTSEKMLK